MATSTRAAPRATEEQPKQPRYWNVVLHDDDEHTYHYVISMMRSLFGHSKDQSMRIAESVDREKRAVCMTTHKELAELKRDQIHAFGRDPTMAESKGSMTATIEPAEFVGDENAEGRK